MSVRKVTDYVDERVVHLPEIEFIKPCVLCGWDTDITLIDGYTTYTTCDKCGASFECSITSVDIEYELKNYED